MNRSAPMRTPLVVLGLAVIAVLAFVLPFWAVRTLHVRRIAAVHQELSLLAVRIHPDDLASRAGVLVGPGNLPRSIDPLWTSGTSAPLGDLAAHTDPWGNGYVVNLGASATDNAPIWVLSAGPDGVIQTPFLQSDGVTAGDDLARRLR